jgi:hypothetical protein
MMQSVGRSLAYSLLCSGHDALASAAVVVSVRLTLLRVEASVPWRHACVFAATQV